MVTLGNGQPLLIRTYHDAVMQGKNTNATDADSLFSKGNIIPVHEVLGPIREPLAITDIISFLAV